MRLTVASEDPDHQHHLFGGCPTAEDVDALHQRQSSRCNHRIGTRYHEGDSDGYLVEVTSNDAGD